MSNDQLMVMCDGGDDILVANAFGARTYGDVTEPPFTYLSLYACTFYSKQVSFARRLWERFKLLVSIALGREYLLEEVVIYGAEKHRQLAEFFTDQALRAAQHEKEEL